MHPVCRKKCTKYALAEKHAQVYAGIYEGKNARKYARKYARKHARKHAREYDKYDEVVVGSTYFAYFRNICTPQCPHLADDNKLELEILQVPRLWLPRLFDRVMH